jgi:hypothetical protein
MNRVLVIVVLLLAVSCLVSGQSQTSPPPKPGPEVLRLGSFIGTWKTETETVTWEWFTGGFSLIGHVENSGPAGKSSELRIITYDPDAKDYTQYRVTSTALIICCERANGSVNPCTEAGPWESRSITARRVGSDRAANVVSNLSTTIW